MIRNLTAPKSREPILVPFIGSSTEAVMAPIAWLCGDSYRALSSIPHHRLAQACPHQMVHLPRFTQADRKVQQIPLSRAYQGTPTIPSTWEAEAGRWSGQSQLETSGILPQSKTKRLPRLYLAEGVCAAVWDSSVQTNAILDLCPSAHFQCTWGLGQSL